MPVAQHPRPHLVGFQPAINVLLVVERRGQWFGFEAPNNGEYARAMNSDDLL